MNFWDHLFQERALRIKEHNTCVPLAMPPNPKPPGWVGVEQNGGCCLLKPEHTQWGISEGISIRQHWKDLNRIWTQVIWKRSRKQQFALDLDSLRKWGDIMIGSCLEGGKNEAKLKREQVKKQQWPVVGERGECLEFVLCTVAFCPSLDKIMKSAYLLSHFIRVTDA